MSRSPYHGNKATRHASVAGGDEHRAMPGISGADPITCIGCRRVLQFAVFVDPRYPLLGYCARCIEPDCGHDSVAATDFRVRLENADVPD